MGHLINPISTRLSLSSFWVSTWSQFILAKFSYNLMVDNIVRNLISWVFTNSQIAVQLSIVGVFLSHFKIVRRVKSIRVYVYLILNSSIFLKSQSVEFDPASAAFLVDLQLIANQYLYKINNIGVYKKLIILSVLKKLCNTYITKIIEKNLNLIFKFNAQFSQYGVSLDVSFLKQSKFISANFLSRFIARRLSFGFELNRVVNPIIGDLTKLVKSPLCKILGFKIACSGRFNKTQMASYSWEKYGPIRLNNFSASVDYSLSKVFLRYGLCGIKVWVFNFAYPFRSYKAKLMKSRLIKQFSDNLIQFNKSVLLKFTNFVIIKKIFKLFFFEIIISLVVVLFKSRKKSNDWCYSFLMFSRYLIKNIQFFL